MKNQANHVMIDLETVGTIPGSAIVSIGAVIFDPRYATITDKTFYSECDYANQQDDGLTVDESTLAWWEDQSPQVREALLGLDDLKESLLDLSKWLPRDCKVWGNGATFDITMLEHCYRLYKLPIPWKFWNVRDCRTVKDMYECTRGGLQRGMGSLRDKKHVHHNALGDAQHQAKEINRMWNLLVGDK